MADRHCFHHPTVGLFSLPWLSSGVAAMSAAAAQGGQLHRDLSSLQPCGWHSRALGLPPCLCFLVKGARGTKGPAKVGVTHSKPLPVKLCKPKGGLEVIWDILGKEKKWSCWLGGSRLLPLRCLPQWNVKHCYALCLGL